MIMLQMQVELRRVSACSRAKPQNSGSARHGTRGTNRGRDPAEVNSPALGQQLGCSGMHVIDAIHQRGCCHHPVRHHGGSCRPVWWETQARQMHCPFHRARLGGYWETGSPWGITAPSASSTAPTAVSRSALRSGPEARLAMPPRASRTSTVGVARTCSRRVRSIRCAASISTNATPSRAPATSVSSSLVGPQYAHTSVEN